jgi:hypothetical protein
MATSGWTTLVLCLVGVTAMAMYSKSSGAVIGNSRGGWTCTLPPSPPSGSSSGNLPCVHKNGSTTMACYEVTGPETLRSYAFSLSEHWISEENEDGSLHDILIDDTYHRRAGMCTRGCLCHADFLLLFGASQGIVKCC